MKRVLVTGCWGFVGRVVVEMLQSRGFEAWGTDRRGSISDFPGKEYVPCDLQDERAVTLLLDDVRPDAILHLAAQSSAAISFDDPLGTFRNNVWPALHIMDFLRTRSLKTRFLAIGSAEEYGPVDAEQMPIREDFPRRPVNPYAMSKMIQNECCALYADLYQLDVVTTRSFNHTGPGQSDIFVLSNFARQIVEIERDLRPPMIEVGNLDVRRDFLDVRDVGEAYIALLQKGKRAEVYNVCSGTSHSIRDLLDRLSSIAGVEVEVRVAKDRLRPADTLELRGDPAKIARDTGWKPRIPIEESLGGLLGYWREAFEKRRGEMLE